MLAAASDGGPDCLQGVYSLSPASFLLANSVLSQMSIKTFVVCNLVATLLVKLGALELSQTHKSSFIKETHGEGNLFLEVDFQRVSFYR